MHRIDNISCAYPGIFVLEEKIVLTTPNMQVKHLNIYWCLILHEKNIARVSIS